MSANKYTEGDQVRIRKDLIGGKVYNTIECLDDMLPLAGTVQTIAEVDAYETAVFYKMVDDPHDYWWEESMLEPDGKDDPVNHPSHYTSGGIECIDAIEAAVGQHKDPVSGFLVGQVIKYVWRFPLKGKPVQDLEKAQWYLNRLIERTKKEAGGDD